MFNWNKLHIKSLGRYILHWDIFVEWWNRNFHLSLWKDVPHLLTLEESVYVPTQSRALSSSLETFGGRLYAHRLRTLVGLSDSLGLMLVLTPHERRPFQNQANLSHGLSVFSEDMIFFFTLIFTPQGRDTLTSQTTSIRLASGYVYGCIFLIVNEWDQPTVGNLGNWAVPSISR